MAYPANFTETFFDPTGYGVSLMASQKGFELLNVTLDTAACHRLAEKELWGPSGDYIFWKIRLLDPSVPDTLCRFGNKADFSNWYFLGVLISWIPWGLASLYAGCVRWSLKDQIPSSPDVATGSTAITYTPYPQSNHHRIRGGVILASGFAQLLTLVLYNAEDNQQSSVGQAIFRYGNPYLTAMIMFDFMTIGLGAFTLLNSYRPDYLHPSRLRPLYNSMHFIIGVSLLFQASAFDLDRTISVGGVYQYTGVSVPNSTWAIVLSVAGFSLVLRALLEAGWSRTVISDPWYGYPEWNLHYLFLSLILLITYGVKKGELMSNPPVGYFQHGYHTVNWIYIAFSIFGMLFAMGPLVLMFLQAFASCVLQKNYEGFLITENQPNTTPGLAVATTRVFTPDSWQQGNADSRLFGNRNNRT